MRFLFIICVSVYFAMMPSIGYAMDTGVRFTATAESWLGEVWYDHTLWWQMVFCKSAAMPASTSGDSALHRTYIFPDFKNGLLLFHINP